MEIFSFSSLVIDIDQIVSLKVYMPALTSLPGTLKALWTIFNQQNSGQASVATVLQSLLQHISAYAVSKPWLWKVGDSYTNQRCTSANGKHGCSFVALRCMILFRIPSILYTTIFCREHACLPMSPVLL